MKQILIILLMSASFSYGQDSSNVVRTELKEEIFSYVKDSLNLEIEGLKAKVSRLNKSVKSREISLNKKIDLVSSDLTSHSDKISQLINQNDKALRLQVSAIYDSLEQNTIHVKANDNIIKSEQVKSEQNLLYSIIGVLVLLLLLVGVYLVMQKKTKNIEQKTGDLDDSTKDIKSQLSKLSTSVSEDMACALDKFANLANTSSSVNATPDHSMVLEFAKQIISMENNISRMDPKDRGLKHINKSIKKMHDSLKIMEYEIIPWLGKEVNEGVIIEIDKQELDESIEVGKLLVFNVLKADVQYRGKQIQRGKVDVKVNPEN